MLIFYELISMKVSGKRSARNTSQTTCFLIWFKLRSLSIRRGFDLIAYNGSFAIDQSAVYLGIELDVINFRLLSGIESLQL